MVSDKLCRNDEQKRTKRFLRLKQQYRADWKWLVEYKERKGGLTKSRQARFEHVEDGWKKMNGSFEKDQQWFEGKDLFDQYFVSVYH